MLILIGTQSKAQQTRLVTGVQDFRSDTVLVVTKQGAINMANYKRQVDNLIKRFENQLTRHDALIDLWEATSQRADAAERTIRNQQAQLAIKDTIIQNQNEKIAGFKKQTKKEKRKSWFNGVLVGAGTALAAGVVIMATNQ